MIAFWIFELVDSITLPLVIILFFLTKVTLPETALSEDIFKVEPDLVQVAFWQIPVFWISIFCKTFLLSFNVSSYFFVEALYSNW